MENVIIDRSVVVVLSPHLPILFLKTPKIQGMSSLARPVMGTIFLVYICMSGVCRGPNTRMLKVFLLGKD